jgi:hypothetical protein
MLGMEATIRLLQDDRIQVLNNGASQTLILGVLLQGKFVFIGRVCVSALRPTKTITRPRSSSKIATPRLPPISSLFPQTSRVAGDVRYEDSKSFDLAYMSFFVCLPLFTPVIFPMFQFFYSLFIPRPGLSLTRHMPKSLLSMTDQIRLQTATFGLPAAVPHRHSVAQLFPSNPS